MHIKSVVLSYLYNASANVGAMVGDTLEVGKYIGKHEAVLDGALALLQTEDVLKLDLEKNKTISKYQRMIEKAKEIKKEPAMQVLFLIQCDAQISGQVCVPGKPSVHGKGGPAVG